MTDLTTQDFDYDLPEELVAYTPAHEREASRLMVVGRRDGEIRDARFDDLPRYLEPHDVVVVNDTKVIRARLEGRKRATGGRVEVLLVREIKPRVWKALVSPSRRVNTGVEIEIAGRYRCVVIERLAGAKRVVEFADDVDAVLEDVGKVPLPPYIKREPEAFDLERYQTVFARRAGSVAAPTAGLHFSESLLDKIRDRGVRLATLTLHVGPGTFQPVRTEHPREHELEPEYFEVDQACCDALNAARASGRRVIAVGTTSVRALETVADRSEGDLKPQSGWTHKFILPPYDFKMVDTLVTNFHLPRSTLIMLVCAFADRALIMEAYRRAVAEKYRFFSYGDAMLIL